jgi:hypothetical protein
MLANALGLNNRPGPGSFRLCPEAHRERQDRVSLAKLRNMICVIVFSYKPSPLTISERANLIEIQIVYEVAYQFGRSRLARSYAVTLTLCHDGLTVLVDHHCYWSRSATIGSTRLARRAGK